MNTPQSADQKTVRGSRVSYGPPKQWEDAAAGRQGTVVSDPAMTTDGDWFVLVQFDNEPKWRSIHVMCLEILP